MRRASSIALIGLGLLAVCLGWVFAARHGPVANVGSAGGFLSVMTLAFVIAGAVVTWRTSRRWTGALVQVVAISTVAAATSIGSLGAVDAGYGVIGLATILLPALVVFDHPDGIQDRWIGRMLAVAIAATAALALPIVLAAHGRSGASTTWWNTPTAHGALPLARVLFGLHTAVTVVTLLLVLAVMALRLKDADRAWRRVLDPVWIPGIMWATVTMASQLARLAGPSWALNGTGSHYSLTVPALLLFLALPALSVGGILSGVVWTQLVVPRLRRTTAGVAIDYLHDPAEVGRQLATALGDPSATVVFLAPDGASWVDGNGRSTTVAHDDDRAVMVLRRDGLVLGAIDFDAALAAEPDTVELAATATAYAIDNARLVALASAKAEESRRLAARLVTSADAARAELVDRLAIGPLLELESIEGWLAEGGDPTEAARRLQGVTAEVRRISHGIFPPELMTGGLSAALPELRSPDRRFATAIEVTAFMAAHGDPDAFIYDDAEGLRIELSVPPTRPDLLDRVAVLGGDVRGKTITLPAAG